MIIIALELLGEGGAKIDGVSSVPVFVSFSHSNGFHASSSTSRRVFVYKP